MLSVSLRADRYLSSSARVLSLLDSVVLTNSVLIQNSYLVLINTDSSIKLVSQAQRLYLIRTLVSSVVGW